MNMRRVIEIMWLTIAAISVIEMMVGLKKSGFKSEHFQLFAILFFASAFMYFFRRKQRLKLGKPKQKDDSK